MISFIYSRIKIRVSREQNPIYGFLSLPHWFPWQQLSSPVIKPVAQNFLRTMKQQFKAPDELLAPQNEEGFSLKTWFSRMFSLWPWFLLSLAGFLTFAYLYLRYTNPVYNAEASIIVKDEKKGAELLDNSMMKEIGLGGNNKLV